MGTEAFFFFMTTEEIVLFNLQKVQNLQGGAAADTQSSSVIMDSNHRNVKEEGKKTLVSDCSEWRQLARMWRRLST